MPELLEVEVYRRQAERTKGRVVVGVDAPDAWFVNGGLDDGALQDALVGRRVERARRRGKLLLLDTDGPVLGLRFGMTGRLVLDGTAAIEELLHAGRRDEPAWIRFSLRFAGGGALGIDDPRRLGGVELDPDEDRLGPDALHLRPAQLRVALAGSRAPLKARLLDQARIAGLGNLLVDETCWRAGLDPARPASSLAEPELRSLHRHLRITLTDLMARGGSHTGDLQAARVLGGRCPRDGAELSRRTIAGRTTFSCPRHQR